jgi:STE24 endopeptidase
MKAALVVGLLLFVAVFVLTTFLPDAYARLEAERYFVPEVIARGLQRARQGKLLFWGSTAVHLGALVLVVFSGLGRRLADLCERWTGRRWLLTVLGVGGVLFIGDELLSLPFGLVGLEWQRSWGLTHQSLGAWLTDHIKGLAISAIAGAVLVAGLYALIRRFPRSWWALAAGGATLLGIAYAIVLPVWINPLFNTFRPLAETQWTNLREPVKALAARVGVPVQDILVMDASRQGSHTNAYFTGFGATRRVVLFDTLLMSHTRQSSFAIAAAVALPASAFGVGPLLAVAPPLAQMTLGEEEVLSILAHEFGHREHQHIVKGIVLGCLGAFVGLFLLSCILKWAVDRRPFCLTTAADPAGLPLILLTAVLGSWVIMPLENAISRHFERQADRFSLDEFGHPEAFIEAEKRLARDNISNVAPNRLSVWLFASHPPAVARIQMAESWRNRVEP